MYIPEIQKQIEEIFFDFEVIAFQLVSVNPRFYWERILVIGCDYVNKQSQNYTYYKNQFLELIFFQRNQIIWEKYCRGD